MSCPLLIFGQSGYLIQIVAINLHTWWQTVQIQISWLLQKPTDLDLHCLQNRVYPSAAGQGLTYIFPGEIRKILTLKLPITTSRLLCHLLVILKDILSNSMDPDQTSSSLIRVHIICLYAKIGLKTLQEYSADDINRRHFQMQVFLAF